MEITRVFRAQRRFPQMKKEMHPNCISFLFVQITD
jgi:hypothetical protein